MKKTHSTKGEMSMGKWQMVYIPSKKEIGAIKARRIMKKIPNLLDKVDVWCCKQTIKRIKCELTKCKFKTDRNDVARGCCLCQTFQITSKSKSWKKAKFLYDFGDVVDELMEYHGG